MNIDKKLWIFDKPMASLFTCHAFDDNLDKSIVHILNHNQEVWCLHNHSNNTNMNQNPTLSVNKHQNADNISSLR